MSFLSKIGKGLKKIVKSKVFKAVGKAALGVVPGGQLVGKAASVARSLGAAVKTHRQSKSVVAAIAKLDQLPALQTGMTPTNVKPNTMPGGAPLPKAPGTRKPKAKRAAKAPKAAKGKRVFSAKQLAAQERFKAMVAAKRKKG